ncbi:YpiB family protein [Staphylococcus ratti]|uniref:YpiB family protein n=1 Tax=Staphylococcus ratti TaxID=2892440 RepID=A0ABY3PA27_9STAP|nr:YpiB family protein [Staphylococcus ratti]UEX89153.1 YpiB family protein [Staphylococcus ratti]
MFEKPLYLEKQHFIDYLLFQYQFKSRISVWILNYMKVNAQRVKRIHFVDRMIDGHQTLELATENSTQPAIRLKFKGETLINSNEIFDILIKSNENFDIKIHFSHARYHDDRLEHLILHQLLTNQANQPYVEDILNIRLTSTSYQYLIHLLESQVDLSLQIKDKQAFRWYSQLLRLLQNDKH